MLAHNTSSLPLLALPIGTLGSEDNGCNRNAVLVINAAFLETVLDCDENKDPLGLLALINRKSLENAGSLNIQFYKMDFQPGCGDNQIKLILFEKMGRTALFAALTGGQWPPLLIDVESKADKFTLTLRKTVFLSKSSFLDGISFDIPYDLALTKPSNAPPVNPMQSDENPYI